MALHNRHFFKKYLPLLFLHVILILFFGPLVKRLRRGPLKAESWVRFPYGSPKLNPLQIVKSCKGLFLVCLLNHFYIFIIHNFLTKFISYFHILLLFSSFHFSYCLLFCFSIISMYESNTFFTWLSQFTYMSL